MLSLIKEKIASGKRINKDDVLQLFESDDLFGIAELASDVVVRFNGNKAYYIRNRHINPTNICVNRCKFCAFSRSKSEEGTYELSIEDIIEKISNQQSARSESRSGSPRRVASTSRRVASTISDNYTEVHIVGGLHPDWPFEYYLNLVSEIKNVFPYIYIKAFTAVEIDYFSKISGLGLIETLKKLKEHGLDTMPGGGAEVFSSSVRKKLCPEKISGERWLEVHETAHEMGIKTNATMLYGHVESYEDRVDHLLRLRELQDRTGGFQAFIPLSYHPKDTEIGGSYPSGVDDLKTISISRLVLDNFPHIKAYWIMLGEKLSQTALLFGADDIDGTIIEEKITHSAGAMSGESLTVEQMRYIISKAGKIPVERDSFYREK